MPRDFPSGPVNPDNPSVGGNLAMSGLGVLVWKEVLHWQHGIKGTQKPSNQRSCLTILAVLSGKFSTAMCSSGMGLGSALKSALCCNEDAEIHGSFKDKGDLLLCKSPDGPLNLSYLQAPAPPAPTGAPDKNEVSVGEEGGVPSRKTGLGGSCLSCFTSRLITGSGKVRPRKIN